MRAMKMHADRYDGTNAIARHGPDGVIVGGVTWTESVVVPWQGTPFAWHAASFDAITAEHFAQLVALAPEVVIFGSGPRLHFPRPALLRPLIEAGIGHETMDSAAACRTYNVLIGEGRSAVAALVFAPASPT